jgi:hypothetical protein
VKVHHRYQQHQWQITGGKFATSINNIDAKFTAGIHNTSGKFATIVNDTGGKCWEQYQTAYTLK